MKKYFLFFLMLILIPAQSFSWIDGSVYGGITYHGDIKVHDSHYKEVRGYDYGLMAHLNLNLSLFLLGFGLNYQAGNFNYDADGDNADFKIKSSCGPDFILMFKTPTINPYGRIGFSIVDELEYDYGTEKKEKSRILNSGWWAIGCTYEVVEYILIFAEYQRCSTNLNMEHKLVRNSAHSGLMLLF